MYIKSILNRLIYFGRYYKIKIFAPLFVCGESYAIGHHLHVSRKNKVKLGKNVYIGNHCHFGADINIGNNVLIASYVSVVGGDHKIDFIEGLIIDSGREIFKTIQIEDNVWIGHGAIIIHGVRVHAGAVIAAGSVVTKNVAANSIVGGNPAKLLRMRKGVDL